MIALSPRERVASVASQVRGYFGMLIYLTGPLHETDPSPVPLQLMKAPAAGHLSPRERAVLPFMSRGTTKDGTDSELRTPHNRRFLILILKLIKLKVNAPSLQQLLVSSHFSDPPFMHYHDFAGVLNGGQSVRDDQGRAVLDQTAHPFPQQVLCLGIHARGSFIQDQDSWVVDERASEREQLLLAYGERGAALFNGFLETARQPLDEFQESHLARRSADLLDR